LPSDHLIEVLNDLISTSRDGEEGLGKAAKGVHDDRLRDLLTGFAKQHSDFAGKLQEEVRRLGGQPAERGHAGGVQHRGWVDLETRIRPKDDRSFLEECRSGEEGTLKHFQHALAQDLPEDLRKMVELESRVIQGFIDRFSQEMSSSGAAGR
jgi:uncharacterized protein (TIGR02284 family)